MCAAEELAADLYSVPDHFTLAMLADGCHRLNRAFEAVEYVLCTCSFDNKGLIVFVATNFAVRHRNLPECKLCRNRQARASSIPRF
jgi:hypothetical protein